MQKRLNSEEIKQASLRLKILYFISFIGFGAIAPLASTFYKKVILLPNGEPALNIIGMIFFLTPLVGFISNLLTGIISDKLQDNKKVLAGIATIAAISSIGIGISGETLGASLPFNIKVAWIIFTSLIYTFAITPINSLLDTETIGFLEKNSDRKYYGRYRTWGTISWAVVTLSVGILLFYTKNYSHIYYVGAVAYLAFAIILFKGHTKENTKKNSKVVKINWGLLFKDKQYLIFLFFLLIGGIVNSSTFSYMGYFFEEVMSNPIQIGAIFCFWTTFEIPIMHYSDKIMEKFGTKNVMILGLLLTALKLWLFSLFTLETPFVYKFMAALIHGGAFGLHHLAIVEIVASRAKEGMKSTYMNVATIARATIAGSIGGWLGSVLIEKYGGADFMKMGAIIILLLIVFFMLFLKGITEKVKTTK